MFSLTKRPFGSVITFSRLLVAAKPLINSKMRKAKNENDLQEKSKLCKQTYDSRLNLVLLKVFCWFYVYIYIYDYAIRYIIGKNNKTNITVIYSLSSTFPGRCHITGLWIQFSVVFSRV